MSSSYIFLDRDGTLIKHIPYLTEPDKVELLPNVIEGLELLKELGFRFGIITNQSVIGRGLATKIEVDRVNAKVIHLLKSREIVISFVKVCPHKPSDLCFCRKPATKLGIDVVEEFGIDISSSYMVGDSESDISFGQNIGCHTVQIVTSPNIISTADYATIDLLNAARYIQSQIERVPLGF
jgi:D-glycero-D-manno-heptose 1,7-bisphosphate phosphatase